MKQINDRNAQYKRYFSSKEYEGVALLNVAIRAIMAVREDLPGRLGKLGMDWRLKGTQAQLERMYLGLLDSHENEDKKQALLRKLNTYQLEIKPIPAKQGEYHIVARDDMNAIIDYILEKCAYECPCVTYRDDGSESVDLCAYDESDKGRFCPYWGR